MRRNNAIWDRHRRCFPAIRENTVWVERWIEDPQWFTVRVLSHYAGQTTSLPYVLSIDGDLPVGNAKKRRQQQRLLWEQWSRTDVRSRTNTPRVLQLVSPRSSRCLNENLEIFR